MRFPDTVQAITFDAAGTLIHLAEPVGASYSRVAQRYDIDCDADTLSAAFGKVWKRTPLPFDNAAPRDPNERAWWKRLVHAVFTESGASLPGDDVFTDFFHELYEHFESPGTWLADTHAKEVLTAAGGKYRLAVLSNFDARLRRILSDLDLLGYFDVVILSCETGASKPSPKIFQRAAKELNLPAKTILHVGDDPRCDGEGSVQAGFRHFRVGKTGKPLLKLIDELSLA